MKRASKLEYDPARFFLQKALTVDGDEREIQLAKAWLLCEFMIYQPELAWKTLQNPNLDPQIVRMAIQKCLDSRRVTGFQKTNLKRLRQTLSAQ